MFRKLFSKKWMFLCLFLGSMLLTATVVSFPLYQNAVFDRMLRDEFENSLRETGEQPGKIRRVVIAGKKSTDDPIGLAEEAMSAVSARTGAVMKEMVSFYQLTQWKFHLVSGRRDVDTAGLRMACMSGLPEHVELIAGEMYSEDGLARDGSIEVVIHQSCMLASNLLLGETLEADSLKDAEGNPVRLKIVGIFQKSEGDFYWEIGTSELKNICLMQEDLLQNRFLGSGQENNATCRYCGFLDYESLTLSQAEALWALFEEDEGYRADLCKGILESFQAKRVRIAVTLFILQVPVLVLLAAFLFMVSGQMYELEKNEISVIKSRGSSGRQIFRLYLGQSLFLAGAGTAFGIPLGVVFCRILGSASNFLEFGLRRRLEVHFDRSVCLYLGAAVFATVTVMAIPAVRHSRVSIVHLKQRQAAKKRAWWEVIFLDVICLAAGLYGYYSYSVNQEKLFLNFAEGRALDPLLYLSSSLFITGAGLFFLRLQPLLVQLVYRLGERFWRPAAYASFLELLKNGRKQHFIMLFLILTVSLGTFHATVARTILQNARNNAAYLDGADIIIREVWTDNSAQAAAAAEDGEDVELTFFEPDFQKYSTLDVVQSCTKVFYDDPGGGTPGMRSYVAEQNRETDVTLMGIHTKEFGGNTWVSRELLEKHYYEYLNALAADPYGILVSRNFQIVRGYEEGQIVWYYCDITMGKGDVARKIPCVGYGRIVGFVDYWPGFVPYSVFIDGRGEAVMEENYLVAANLEALKKQFGLRVLPYEVWMTLKEDAEDGEAARWVNDNELKVEKYVDRRADLRKTVEDPLLQGTNGVLTMGFLVMILLCGVGYLIYWVMSIRSREMMFGILRAVGMHKRELFGMLAMEQVFSGALSILAGIGIGKLASDLYVPMLQMAYAAADQVLPMRLYTNPADMYRLYAALGLVVAVCLVVLILIVFGLNVAKALKLGEE